MTNDGSGAAKSGDAGRIGRDDIDRLVDRALGAVGTFARKGSTLTTGVALVAAFVVGLAYLVGLAAFGGGTRTVWLGVGAVMLLAAVGAPLLASMRLRAIPKQSTELAGELRTLLGKSEDAKRVVIETVAAEDGATGSMPSGRPVPALVFQSQHYTRLRTITGATGEFKTLASAFQSLASIPGLMSVGLLLTGLGGFLGFVFTLIWIF